MSTLRSGCARCQAQQIERAESSVVSEAILLPAELERFLSAFK